MRPIISYDDITVPAAAEVTVPEPVPQLGAQGPPSHQRPTKRRKSNHKGNINSNQKGRVSNFRSTHGGNTNGRGRGGQRQYVQHWDDPNLPEETVRYGEEASAGLSPVDHEEQGEEVAGEEGIIVEEGDEDEDENEDEEMSRDLTYEEIWDDSALIEAWNSATAEYEAYHGKAKGWKEEPPKQSPLWYNVPPKPPKKSKSTSSTSHHLIPQNDMASTLKGPSTELDSQPINFDTFVPTHDPSLAGGLAGAGVPAHPPDIPGPSYAEYYLPHPPGPMVSQDEAFQRALAAMYWGGYWTAVYHCQRSAGDIVPEQENVGEDEQGEEEADEELDEEFVPTQR